MHAPDRDREDNSKSMGSGLLGIELDDDDNPLHPRKYRLLIVFLRDQWKMGPFL